MTFIPFANVSVFPYMTKILFKMYSYFVIIDTLVFLYIFIYICTRSNDYKLEKKNISNV